MPQALRPCCRSIVSTLVLTLAVAVGGLYSSDLRAAAVEDAVATLDADLWQLAEGSDPVGIAAAVVRGRRLIYLRTWGDRELGGADVIDAETRFRTASLSKGFAGLLAAILDREGVLSISDTIQTDVPFFELMNPVESRRATWEDALSHRLGLPHYAYDRLLEANWAPDDIVRRYARVRPTCSVGACYGYQNISFNLVADAIDRRTPQGYKQLVADRLFAAARMPRANFGISGLTQDDNFARPHVRQSGSLVAADLKEHYYRLPAAAGVNASIDDMARWLIALLGHREEISREAISSAWVERIHTRREMSYGWRGIRLDDAHYGLGFRIYDYAGTRVIFHAGAVEGYRAQFALVPELDVGMVAMWNTESGKPWGSAPVFLDALLGLGRRDWMNVEDDDAIQSASE